VQGDLTMVCQECEFPTDKCQCLRVGKEDEMSFPDVEPLELMSEEKSSELKVKDFDLENFAFDYTIYNVTDKMFLLWQCYQIYKEIYECN